MSTKRKQPEEHSETRSVNVSIAKMAKLTECPRSEEGKDDPSLLSKHIFEEVDGTQSIILVLGQFTDMADQMQNKLTDLPLDKWDSATFMKKRVPRLQMWFAPPGQTYRFGGTTYRARAYTEWMTHMQRTLNTEVQKHLTTPLVANTKSTLALRYADEDDSISPHSDDEKILGRYPTIISLSAGVTREFRLTRMSERVRERQCQKMGISFTPNPNRKPDTIKIPLSHGIVVVMAGATQEFWHHSVPKAKTNMGCRFNMTFRPIAQNRH
jgi:alkylated DNA repair dioxygenase AlkB